MKKKIKTNEYYSALSGWNPDTIQCKFYLMNKFNITDVDMLHTKDDTDALRLFKNKYVERNPNG